jgi:tRNA uridine 5-carboxymethylaminomethyl modification enzyme
VKHYDVIVIGGGHAGVEAACGAARRGAQTALVTMRRDTIGVMSCNPAMGGLGKGHLIREIDALDGVMGRAADAAGIQFRLLNRSKGPAVQGPRAQIDRALYRCAMQAAVSAQIGLDVIEGEVARLLTNATGVAGVVLLTGVSLTARAVVVTAGTFLNGVLHIGDTKRPGGRAGDAASVSLGHYLADLGLRRGRLKTGTPPRLDGSTIDWARVDMQAGDEEPVMLSFLTTAPAVLQVSCGVTQTNDQTHDIVRKNIELSAMYGGHVEGVGPRYCPSIEDKVVRFADKNSHQVYLEPEGLDDKTVYPNGISTSLPAHVQEAYVRTIKGLEHVQILQPGYAIEYDYFDPRGLASDLSVNGQPGLFFAGQINGTTGYEEAAAQGIVAGLNAAASALDLEPALFGRTDSYIGVLIDDLTTRGVTEPYRMFTSRAEFRLSLRADNADQRLTPIGRRLGCVGDTRWHQFAAKKAEIATGTAALQSARFTSKDLAPLGILVSQDGQNRSGFALLGPSDVSVDQMAVLVPGFRGIGRDIQRQIAIEALYAPYQQRQLADVRALQAEESQRIPPDFSYDALPGLSSELKAKLQVVRPGNLAQAGRIEGMTPAALTLILARIRLGARLVVTR